MAVEGNKRVFGRVYDFKAGTVTITSLTDASYKRVLSFKELPEATQMAFGLQNFADFAIGAANENLRGDPKAKEPIPPGDHASAIAELDEAVQEAMDGKVDFREGAGVGGNRSMIGNVARAACELGRTSLKYEGKSWTWTDIPGAKAAFKELYAMTETKDAAGKAKMSGRQLFSAIKNRPEFVEKVASYRTTKAQKVADDALGGGEAVEGQTEGAAQE